MGARDCLTCLCYQRRCRGLVWLIPLERRGPGFHNFARECDCSSKFAIDLSEVSGFNGNTSKTSKKDGDGGMAKMLSNMRPQAPPADKQASIMAGLLIGSPEFQRR